MRRLLPLVFYLALGAAAALALAQVDSAPGARAAAISATGAFEISDSHDGRPIFAATGVAPGESTGGTVTIEDSGSDPASLTLRRGELIDAPGLGGGVLSSRLEMTVADVTEPAAPRTLYAGPLDSMPDEPAGNLQPGEARTFEFTATLPTGGNASFQNAVQAASTTVAYSWVAAEVEEEEEEEEGGSGGEAPTAESPSGEGGTVTTAPTTPQSGGGATDSTGTTPGGGGGAGGVEAARKGLELTVPRARPTIRAGRLVVWTTCNEACRLTIGGRLRARAASGHRGAKIRFAARRTYTPGEHRLRIALPRPLKRWLHATPGRKHVRAKLRFVASAADGSRDIVRKTLKLRARRR